MRTAASIIRQQPNAAFSDFHLFRVTRPHSSKPSKCRNHPAVYIASPRRPATSRARWQSSASPESNESSTPVERIQDNSQPAEEDQLLRSGTVIFMAVASEFATAALYRHLARHRKVNRGMEVSTTGSVLLIRKLALRGLSPAEAFVFPYGCMVVWGSDSDSDGFFSLVKNFASQLRTVPLVDKMEYEYGQKGAIRRDLLTLESKRDRLRRLAAQVASDLAYGFEPSLERLAVSCALAQSIKLSVFESAMRNTIANTRHLPQELASTGQITASRKEVSRLMGQLFLDRYQYHLSGDLLMTPAFFWENELYLPSYRRVERYLEVRERGENLNKRVEVVQELYTLLGDELTDQKSNALELSITVMIAFEILLALITIAKESIKSVFSACALFLCLVTAGWLLLFMYRRFRRSAISFRRKPGAQTSLKKGRLFS